eukprot:759513-Hanusia_phi.AAC.2
MAAPLTCPIAHAYDSHVTHGAEVARRVRGEKRHPADAPDVALLPGPDRGHEPAALQQPRWRDLHLLEKEFDTGEDDAVSQPEDLTGILGSNEDIWDVLVDPDTNEFGDLNGHRLVEVLLGELIPVAADISDDLSDEGRQSDHSADAHHDDHDVEDGEEHSVVAGIEVVALLGHSAPQDDTKDGEGGHCSGAGKAESGAGDLDLDEVEDPLNGTDDEAKEGDDGDHEESIEPDPGLRGTGAAHGVGIDSQGNDADHEVSNEEEEEDNLRCESMHEQLIRNFTCPPAK